MGLVLIDFPFIYHKRAHLLENWVICSFLQKMHFLDILVVFGLDLRQISFNLVDNAFATRELAFLATSITFYDIVTQACTEIKMMPILVKSDDIRSRRKATVHHSQLRAAQASMG